MKKIIVELLEQYEKEAGMPQHELTFYTDERIISKHYGFIKWLVDNDKIDNKKIPQFELVGWYTDVEYSEYENLLMMLAIQDEPIEFLISILK